MSGHRPLSLQAPIVPKGMRHPCGSPLAVMLFRSQRCRRRRHRGCHRAIVGCCGVGLHAGDVASISLRRSTANLLEHALAAHGSASRVKTFAQQTFLLANVDQPAEASGDRYPPIKPRLLSSVDLTKRNLAPAACLTMPRLTARACSGTGAKLIQIKSLQR